MPEGAEKRKPRIDALPTIPFHSLQRGAIGPLSPQVVRVRFTAKLAELSQQAAWSERVMRATLFKHPLRVQDRAATKRLRDESDSDADEGTSTTDGVGSRQMIVDIVRQLPAEGVSQLPHSDLVSFVCPIEVLVADVTPGLMPAIATGAARSEQSEQARVKVHCTDGSSGVVTCFCPPEEAVTEGVTVLLAVEPCSLRAQMFRPPRVSRGAFTKNVDQKLGETSIEFIPDTEGDFAKREDAKRKVKNSD